MRSARTMNNGVRVPVADKREAILRAATHVFARNGSTWSQQAYLKQSNTDAADLFGYSVGLSADGNTLAASAYDEDSSAREINGVQDKNRRGTGAIYVFTRSGTNWAQTA